MNESLQDEMGKLARWAQLMGAPLWMHLVQQKRLQEEARLRDLERMRWEDDGGPVIPEAPIDDHAAGYWHLHDRRGHLVQVVMVTEELRLLREIMHYVLKGRTGDLQYVSPADVFNAERLIEEYSRRFGHLVGIEKKPLNLMETL